MKEVKADAEELGDELLHGVPDTSHKMLKVDAVYLQTCVMLLTISARILDASELSGHYDTAKFGREARMRDMFRGDGGGQMYEVRGATADYTPLGRRLSVSFWFHLYFSLPCEHIFCSSCLSKYQESAPVFKCPECRHSCKDEDSEVVNMTATAQWDHLLGLANDFARMDTTRGAQDTSDEEAEEHAAEDFIDDEEEEAADARCVLLSRLSGARHGH